MPEQSDKACCWSITINNPTDDDHVQWAALSALHWVKEVTGQLEKGEEGTLHIQGMVKTQSVRFAALKKALPRAHIEPARNAAALAKYVSKLETRIAPIAPIKTANQNDVQIACLGVALNLCYQWSASDPLVTDELLLLDKYSFEIKRDWEKILDTAVSSLIYQGFYGVEFVVSNPQVRTAFKKYLPAILYRTYNGRTQATQAREEASSTQACSSQGLHD